MFGIKIVSEKKLKALETEAKGYYDSMNEANEYFRAIEASLRGKKLAPMTPMSRVAIRDAYANSAAVMGVVNYIAENVGEVSRYLELQDSKDNYIENHWVLDLIRHPNDRFNLRRFATAWAINRLLFGDAWVYVPSEEVGKNRGKVERMYLIPSWRIETNSEGALMPLEGIGIAGSAKGEIKMNDCFESFDYNLDDASFFGTSKVVSAAVYLDVIDKGMRRESQSLENGGVANLVTPKGDEAGVLPEHADNLESRFNSKKNVNKTLALRIPVEVHQLGNAPVDLSILDTHKEAVTALCLVAFSIRSWIEHGSTNLASRSSGTSVSTSNPTGNLSLRRSTYIFTKTSSSLRDTTISSSLLSMYLYTPASLCVYVLARSVHSSHIRQSRMLRELKRK